MLESKNRALTLLITTGILLGFAVADYVVPQLMHHSSSRDTIALLVVAGFGICVAQVTLIAAWAVFAPGNFVVRVPLSLLLGLMMWYTLAHSERSLSPSRYMQNLVHLGISIFIGVAAMQIPLWIAKRVFRYRMLSPGEAILPTALERVQFEIKHLLIVMLLLAIALSPLKLVLPDESQRSFRIEWEICAIVGIALVVNLVATLPCFWGGFVSTSRAIVVVPCWLAYCLVVTGLEVAVFYFIRHGPNSDIWDFFLFFDANVTQGAVVFGVMYCFRALGYRLLRVPREMPSVELAILLDEVEEPTVLTDADLVADGEAREN